jgi:penicillin-binding protein 1C
MPRPTAATSKGVGAASRIYFRKDADALTLPEALTLAVLAAGALASRPPGLGRRAARPTSAPAGGGARAPVRALARRHAAIRRATRRCSCRCACIRRANCLPRSAPGRARARRPRAARGPGPRLRTTLDLRLQAIAEERVRSYLQRARRRGLTTPRCWWWTRATWACARWSARPITSTRASTARSTPPRRSARPARP